MHQPSEIGRLLGQIQRTWGVVTEAEITLETNPEDADYHLFAELRAIGINRLSVGAQSTTKEKLSKLYRLHSTTDVAQSVETARKARFENISLDLLFGLPGETLEHWEGDLQQALALQPDHVSLYNLEYHEQTPIWRWRREGRWKPLDSDLEAEMYLLTHNLLTDSGFQHYEVSNFAKPGFRAVHNTGYWTGAPSMGLGPSAFSFDGHRTRTANVADLAAYTELVESGRHPMDRQWHNNPREQAEEWISGRLRQVEGISRQDAEQAIDRETTVRLWAAAAKLPEHTRELTDQIFRFTPEGWFTENELLIRLFEALG